MSEPQVVLVARSQDIADLVRDCAEGRLKFSGPGSLCEQVARMGYRTTSLYEMVCAAQYENERTKP